MVSPTPLFKFTYSFIYDESWHLAFGKPYEINAARRQYQESIKAIEKIWNKSKQQKALRMIAKLLELTWQTEPLKVYFVKHLTYSGFSDPLTIRMTPDIPFLAQTIIHEATHVLMVQNERRVQPGLKYLGERFPDEFFGVRLHLIVNTVANRVFEAQFGKSETDRVGVELRKLKGLRRAFEILDDLESTESFLKQVTSKFRK